MQVSAATGMLSAGCAGVLDSKACVVKGNCSGLVADVAIAAVASRLPTVGSTTRSLPRMSGRAAFGGRDVTVRNMTKYADRHPIEGFYDVLGHGSPNDIAGQSAAEIARKIGPVAGGQNVRLLSCWTGCRAVPFEVVSESWTLEPEVWRG
jgi:hypothetical protein